MDSEKKALDFATIAHAGQKRKYTGEDYIDHPIEEAKIVKSVAHKPQNVAAAQLHEEVEEIIENFLKK